MKALFPPQIKLTHRLLDYSNARSALTSPVGTGITQYQCQATYNPVTSR
jgi:hypothetical protein